MLISEMEKNAEITSKTARAVSKALIGISSNRVAYREENQFKLLAEQQLQYDFAADIRQH